MTMAMIETSEATIKLELDRTDGPKSPLATSAPSSATAVGATPPLGSVPSPTRQFFDNSLAGRVQEVSLQFPILRSLEASGEDIKARSRCVGLIERITTQIALKKYRSGAESPGTGLSPWAAAYEPTVAATANLERERSSKKRNSSGEMVEEASQLLEAQLLGRQTALGELQFSRDGPVAKVFWEAWDEAFVMLTDFVSAPELISAQQGRMFKPAGDAMAFLEAHQVPKRRRMSDECGHLSERQGRLSDASSILTHSSMAEPLSPATSSPDQVPSFDFHLENKLDGRFHNFREQIEALDDDCLTAANELKSW